MKSICKDCIYNCTKDFGKKNQLIVANKPKAICWCTILSRVIYKKYEQCESYTPKKK